MTGAESLLRTAVGAGVEVCFANPGTTEMDIVGALDEVAEMRTVLGLFEGVCTGMADGYGRMTDKPALTLLHLGVGLGNGIANLHNARRARTPIVNLIGDHPTAHIPYDAPLTSDIETMAKPVSNWVWVSTSAEQISHDAAEAIATATGPPGGIATLITRADALREASNGPVAPREPKGPNSVGDGAIDKVAEILRKGETAALLLSGHGVREAGLVAANRIAAQTGCQVLSDCFPARLERGAGLPPVDRLPYFPELVLERLKDVRHLILAGAPAPVSFFLYPDGQSSLVPEGCEVHTLATPDEDIVHALEAVTEAVGAPGNAGARTELSRPDAPTGGLDTHSVGAAIGAALPEGAIIADESATSGPPTYFLTRGCPPHTGMYLTGGGIGWGLPAATGAAVACPDRPVLALQGDGGGMYTLQALWTQAREGLNVTNVIFSNRKYQILQMELMRAGINKPGEKAKALTDLVDPELDWRQLAGGMGVPACRPESAEAFHSELQKSFREPGPHLIELVL